MIDGTTRPWRTRGPEPIDSQQSSRVVEMPIDVDNDDNAARPRRDGVKTTYGEQMAEKGFLFVHSQVDSPFEAFILEMEFGKTPPVFLLGHAQTHAPNAAAAAPSGSAISVFVLNVALHRRHNTTDRTQHMRRVRYTFQRGFAHGATRRLQQSTPKGVIRFLAPVQGQIRSWTDFQFEEWE